MYSQLLWKGTIHPIFLNWSWFGILWDDSLIVEEETFPQNLVPMKTALSPEDSLWKEVSQILDVQYSQLLLSILVI